MQWRKYLKVFVVEGVVTKVPGIIACVVRGSETIVISDLGKGDLLRLFSIQIKRSWDLKDKRGRDSRLVPLLRLFPEIAHVKRGGEIIDIPASCVKAGDCLLVRPGEKVPTDTEMHLAGTLNGDTSLELIATVDAIHSTLSKEIEKRLLLGI